MTFTLRIEMVEMLCGKCQLNFSIPTSLRSKLKISGDKFYCPMGHTQHYGKSQGEADRKTIDELKCMVDKSEFERECAENSLRTQKGVCTKLKTKVNAKDGEIKYLREKNAKLEKAQS